MILKILRILRALRTLRILTILRVLRILRILRVLRILMILGTLSTLRILRILRELLDLPGRFGAVFSERCKEETLELLRRGVTCAEDEASEEGPGSRAVPGVGTLVVFFSRLVVVWGLFSGLVVCFSRVW